MNYHKVDEKIIMYFKYNISLYLRFSLNMENLMHNDSLLYEITRTQE